MKINGSYGIRLGSRQSNNISTCKNCGNVLPNTYYYNDRNCPKCENKKAIKYILFLIFIFLFVLFFFICALF